MEPQNCHPNTSTNTVARGLSNLGATAHFATLHAASATEVVGDGLLEVPLEGVRLQHDDAAVEYQEGEEHRDLEQRKLALAISWIVDETADPPKKHHKTDVLYACTCNIKASKVCLRSFTVFLGSV